MHRSCKWFGSPGLFLSMLVSPGTVLSQAASVGHPTGVRIPFRIVTSTEITGESVVQFERLDR